MPNIYYQTIEAMEQEPLIKQQDLPNKNGPISIILDPETIKNLRISEYMEMPDITKPYQISDQQSELVKEIQRAQGLSIYDLHMLIIIIHDKISNMNV